MIEKRAGSLLEALRSRDRRCGVARSSWRGWRLAAPSGKGSAFGKGLASGKGPVLLLLASLLLASALPAAEGLSPPEERAAQIAELLRQGDEHRALGHHTDAFEMYEEANELTEDPEFEVLARLAESNFRVGRYEAAIRLATEARALTDVASQRAELAYLVGRSYFDTGHIVGRKHDLTKPPEHWDRSMQMAEEALLEATATVPEAAPEAVYLLGRIYEDRGDLEAAVRSYDAYLTLSPGRGFADMARYRLEQLRQPATEPQEAGDASEEDDRQGGENEEMHPPVRIFSPQPSYTPEARRKRVRGRVEVQTIIDKAGEVGRVKVLRGLPRGLDQAALAAVRRWQFEPARLSDGRRVAVYYTLTVDFQPD